MNKLSHWKCSKHSNQLPSIHFTYVFLITSIGFIHMFHLLSKVSLYGFIHYIMYIMTSVNLWWVVLLHLNVCTGSHRGNCKEVKGKEDIKSHCIKAQLIHDKFVITIIVRIKITLSLKYEIGGNIGFFDFLKEDTKVSKNKVIQFKFWGSRFQVIDINIAGLAPYYIS